MRKLSFDCVDNCRFERGGYQSSGSDIFNSRPMMPQVSRADSSSSLEPVCLRSIMHWMERILAALDCYSWTLGQNLLTATQLLAGALTSLDQFLRTFIFTSLCCSITTVIGRASGL